MTIGDFDDNNFILLEYNISFWFEFKILAQFEYCQMKTYFYLVCYLFI